MKNKIVINCNIHLYIFHQFYKKTIIIIELLSNKLTETEYVTVER